MTKHRCKYCEREFARIATVSTHKCQPRERFIYITKTVKGVAFYNLYKQYCGSKRYRVLPHIEFTSSTLYTFLHKGYEFARKKNIPNIGIFFEYTVKKGIPVQLIGFEETYQEYLTYIDTEMEPSDCIEQSISWIIRHCNKMDVEPSKFFNHINTNTLLHDIKQRRLTPWILLSSEKFRTKMLNSSPEQYNVFSYYVNLIAWKHKMKTDSVTLSLAKRVVKELDL